MTFEDGYKIPFRRGDLVHDGRWYYIIYGAIRPSIPQPNPNSHAVMYYALISDIYRDNPYISIGPRPGIGYYESRDFDNITEATNKDKEQFFKQLLKYKGVVWNDERKCLQYANRDGEVEQDASITTTADFMSRVIPVIEE